MKKISKKELIVIVVFLISLVIIYKLPKLLINKNDKTLPEVKLRNIKSSKSFAIMIQNGDGYEEYTSEDNTWPGADYVFKEAKCTDNNGELVDNAITFANGKATLTTNQTIYCTLYFDEKPKPTIDILRAKDKEVSGGVEHLSPEPNLQGGMYRYQGTDNVPNWILFGTREKCEKDEEEKCTNSKLNNMTYDEYVDKYMYRIIGITEEGQMYLLKETFLKEGETANKFAWNTKYLVKDCLGEACEWPNVDLYKRINGTSNGEISGSSGSTNIFVNSSEYDYLKLEDNDEVSGSDDASEWYKLIADHNWMYGDIGDGYAPNGDVMYGKETGNTTTKRIWPDEKQGQTTCSTDNQCTNEPYTWSKSANNVKIGLMYIHDYMYAYANCSSGECSSRGVPGSAENVKNSWIHFQKDGYNTSSTSEWLITRKGALSETNSGVRTWLCLIGGGFTDGTVGVETGVRPVFYLSSKTKIASGDGTKANPFILSV